MNLVAVFSVSAAISTSVFDRNFNRLSSIAFFPGSPVPMEIKHFTSGFGSRVLGHHTFEVSLSTSSTGLLAPNAPSTYFLAPIETGSKNVVAADVARAASQIVAGLSDFPSIL